jgi:hypothetical protein
VQPRSSAGCAMMLPRLLSPAAAAPYCRSCSSRRLVLPPAASSAPRCRGYPSRRPILLHTVFVCHLAVGCRQGARGEGHPCRSGVRHHRGEAARPGLRQLRAHYHVSACRLVERCCDTQLQAAGLHSDVVKPHCCVAGGRTHRMSRSASPRCCHSGRQRWKFCGSWRASDCALQWGAPC